MTLRSARPDAPFRHRLRRLAALLAAAAVTAACAADPPAGGTALGSTASPTPTSSPTAAHAQQPAPAPTSAVGLRSALEMLLGEHVRLTVVLMRDRIAGATERTRATADAVQRNTDELTGAVRGLYGDAAAQQFGLLWSAHVTQLQDYAAGLAGRDQAAQQQARDRLHVTEADVGRLFGAATGGALPAAGAEQAVRMHVDTLLGQADAYAARDYARAYEVGRQSFRHMLEVAGVLAGAMATSKGLPTAELATPRRQLQSALGRLLSEHVGLMTEAMRAAAEGAPEFPAAGTALNANTAELGQAIGTLYGDAAARQFLDTWGTHIEALITHARGAGGAQNGAAPPPTDYARQLAAFLAAATSQRVPEPALAEAISKHDLDLRAATDAYADEDFARAQELSAQGYRHMFELAQTLADAVGDEVAARLPLGGAQTGGGGVAAHH